MRSDYERERRIALYEAKVAAGYRIFEEGLIPDEYDEDDEEEGEVTTASEADFAGEEELLTHQDVAAILKVGLRTVHRLIERGQLPEPAFRLSRKNVRFRKSDITLFLRAAREAS